MGKFPRNQVTLIIGFLSSSIAQVPILVIHIVHQIPISQISSEQLVVKTKLNSLLTEIRVITTSKRREKRKVTIFIETLKSG